MISQMPKDSPARAEPKLVAAARAGDIGQVREQVEAGADLEARGPSGDTALLAAQAAGHGAVARLLRSVGARGTGPALARAASRGDLGEVKRLLASGESATWG